MKHRLVGVSVLVGLGIIAWPVVFDTTPVREISQRSQLPEAPTEQPFVVPEPDPVDIPPEPDSTASRAALPDAPSSSDVSDSAADSPPAAPASPQAAGRLDDQVPPVRTDERGLPEQWALQLGVFSDRANAMELRARAEKAGLHALVQPVGNGPALRYRVYAEPRLDRASVQRAAASVQQKLGIKGYVTRYYP